MSIECPATKAKLCFTKNNLTCKISTLQNSYSNVFHNFQQVIFHTNNTIFATSLEPLAHHLNVASLSHFYRYSSERVQLVLLFYT